MAGVGGIPNVGLAGGLGVGNSTLSTGVNGIVKDLGPNALSAKLTSMNEGIWLRLGTLSELMQDFDKAVQSYENVLRHNPTNVKALAQIAAIFRLKEQYAKVQRSHL